MRRVVVLGLAALVSRPALAHASDTLELWDPGASEVDLYLEVAPSEQERSIDVMFGHGLTPRVSIYLGAILALEPGFAPGAGELYLGTFGTLVDSTHLDLDLLLEASADPDGWGGGPGFELNLDLAPDLSRCGLYGRIQLTLPDATTQLVLGGYVTIAHHHQLLFEHLTEVEDDVGARGVAVGYNLAVGESVEIINQLYVDIPAPGERLSFSIMTGIIRTLPATIR